MILRTRAFFKSSRRAPALSVLCNTPIAGSKIPTSPPGLRTLSDFQTNAHAMSLAGLGSPCSFVQACAVVACPDRPFHGGLPMTAS